MTFKQKLMLLLLSFYCLCAFSGLDIKTLDQLTQQFILSLKKSHRLITDEISNDYLNAICKNLGDHSLLKSQTLHCFILNDEKINAFAGPGGYIGVHSGLIFAAENEHELAAVLAHEIGHIQQAHLIRQLERMQAENLSLTLASLAAIALGIHSPELGQAAILSASAGVRQLELNYSRSQEAEADRAGLKILRKSPYATNGMLDFFKRLINQEHLSIAHFIPEILKSHPLTEHRLADIENRLTDQKTPLKASLAFELFKARLAGICQTKTPLSYQNTQARQYAKSLQLLHEGQYSLMKPLLSELEKINEFDVIKTLFIDYHTASKTPLPKTFKLDPKGATASKLFEYYLAKGEFEKAKTFIQTILSHEPKNPEVWFAFATLASKQHHEAEAYFYRAQAMLLLKKRHEAKRLLSIAQTKKQASPYTKIKIQALLSELK